MKTIILVLVGVLVGCGFQPSSCPADGSTCECATGQQGVMACAEDGQVQCVCAVSDSGVSEDAQESETAQPVDASTDTDSSVDVSEAGATDRCPNNCDDTNVCTRDSCTTTGCTHVPLIVECRSGSAPGICTNTGQCCGGCTAQGVCQPGDQVRACGRGRVCQDCDDGNECTRDVCGAQGCLHDTFAVQWQPCAVQGAGSQCVDGRCSVCGGLGDPCCRAQGRVSCRNAGTYCRTSDYTCQPGP